ncbi:alpha/beta hydrolase [Sungkyunkwania multivorans]|uniref:Alpha/beta hydrolase n=1 Tax=Sungkyunkwania multivorans TaxID=1173618 RepID=A0ABW3CX30_9FLAO
MPKKPTKFGYQQSIDVPQPIIFTAKFLRFISPTLATNFAARLFRSPIKFKIPDRELIMDANSEQQVLHVPEIRKEIRVYTYGNGKKRILLAHGWSGRGTQLVKIADHFIKLGYTTVSFDAPAHGKTGDKTTDMNEFIKSIMFLEEQHGPFEAAIGHSLGGMSLLNAVKRGLHIKKLVTIGSGDIVSHIMYDFVQKLGLKKDIGDRMIAKFERTFNECMDDYSASLAAKDVHIPVLVAHANDDLDVPVSAAHHIRQSLSNGHLLITDGLGHKRILGDKEVIEKIANFIES